MIHWFKFSSILSAAASLIKVSKCCARNVLQELPKVSSRFHSQPRAFLALLIYKINLRVLNIEVWNMNIYGWLDNFPMKFIFLRLNIWLNIRKLIHKKLILDYILGGNSKVFWDIMKRKNCFAYHFQSFQRCTLKKKSDVALTNFFYPPLQ